MDLPAYIRGMESDLPREPTIEAAPEPKSEERALAAFLRMVELGKQFGDLFKEKRDR